MAEERFQMLVSAIIGSFTTPPHTCKMEQGAYDDFARALLGSDAYLVMCFERLFNQILKQMIPFWTNEECSLTLSLFKQ